MNVRLAFPQAVDERFLVLCEHLRGTSFANQGSFSTVAFEDENDFIQQVVLACLNHEDTVTIISDVLLTLARRGQPGRWIDLSLTTQQLRGLRLAPHSAELHAQLSPEELAQLHNVFMQTPTPMAVLTGPSHCFTFCNAAYAELMQRPDIAGVLGRTVREVLPELNGQPFFKLLDDVFRTGEEYIGREVPATLRNHLNGKLEKRYFDFIYYPVRDQAGVVTGIVAQSTDVTVNVLIRQVAESREEQLYKQWAELDTIYRHSPMAMCLLSARDFRILRLNDLTAELLGQSAEELLGKIITDLIPSVSELPYLYNLVVKGEVIRNFQIEVELPPQCGVVRTWLLTLSPLYDEAGNVEMIESVGVEITDRLDITPQRVNAELLGDQNPNTLPRE